MSDPYVNGAMGMPNSSYAPSGMSNMTSLGSQENDMDEEDVLFNLIERERRLYRSPYSRLIRNEQDFLGHFHDGRSYFQRQLDNYLTPFYYGRVKPWNCDFYPPKNVRYEDKQTQTCFAQDDNSFAFQPRKERSAYVYPEWMEYSKELHYADILRRYPHLAPSNYWENMNLRSHRNPYFDFDSPGDGNRDARSNFFPPLYDMYGYYNMRSFGNRGLNDFHQSYSPYSLSHNERRDFKVPFPPEYATPPSRLRRSYPYSGIMNKSGSIGQTRFDGDASRSPRIRQNFDSFDEVSTQCSWEPLSRYSSRNADVGQSPRSYGLQKSFSPTEFELNYASRQKKTHKTPPSTSQPVRNSTKSPSSHLNKPRTYSSINKKTRSPATLQKNEEEKMVDDISLHRRASNVDISSLVENEVPDVPICKSFSDSSIDMADDTCYLPLPTKKSHSKQFSPLPKLHEEPTADSSYGPEKECNYYDENAQILQLDQPENSSHGIAPSNSPKISSHQKLMNERDSTEWDDVWDPNSAFTPTEMEINPGEEQQWQVNEFAKEEEEFGNLADNIIESITKNNEATPHYKASNNKDQDRGESKSRKDSLKIDSSAKIGANLKMKMKLPRRNKNSRRKALDLETMYDMY